MVTKHRVAQQYRGCQVQYKYLGISLGVEGVLKTKSDHPLSVVQPIIKLATATLLLTNIPRLRCASIRLTKTFSSCKSDTFPRS